MNFLDIIGCICVFICGMVCCELYNRIKKLVYSDKSSQNNDSEKYKIIRVALAGGILFCPNCDNYVPSDAEKCDKCGIVYNSKIKPVHEAEWVENKNKLMAVHEKL